MMSRDVVKTVDDRRKADGDASFGDVTHRICINRVKSNVPSVDGSCIHEDVEKRSTGGRNLEDTECADRVRRGNPEYRQHLHFNNPAVSVEYIESPNVSFHGVGDAGPWRSSNSSIPSDPKARGVRRKTCRIGDTVDLDSSRSSQPNKCDSISKDESDDFFKLSLTSLTTTISSTPSTTKEEPLNGQRNREDTFKKWLARKERERKVKELRAKEPQRKQPKTTPQEREASFSAWLQRKLSLAEAERTEAQERRRRQHEADETERRKKDMEKRSNWLHWTKIKEDVLKEKMWRDEEETRKVEKEAADKHRRSQGAYQEWLRISRNKSLPVPLNQGELSMRGSVSNMYINPIPWQSAIDT